MADRHRQEPRCGRRAQLMRSRNRTSPGRIGEALEVAQVNIVVWRSPVDRVTSEWALVCIGFRIRASGRENLPVATMSVACQRRLFTFELARQLRIEASHLRLAGITTVEAANVVAISTIKDEDAKRPTVSARALSESKAASSTE
jgi:hypothetical protein